MSDAYLIPVCVLGTLIAISAIFADHYNDKISRTAAVVCLVSYVGIAALLVAWSLEGA